VVFVVYGHFHGIHRSFHHNLHYTHLLIPCFLPLLWSSYAVLYYACMGVGGERGGDEHEKEEAEKRGKVVIAVRRHAQLTLEVDQTHTVWARFEDLWK
jgi:hypothetical protein